jgi:hypothetical protein
VSTFDKIYFCNAAKIDLGIYRFTTNGFWLDKWVAGRKGLNLNGVFSVGVRSAAGFALL